MQYNFSLGIANYYRIKALHLVGLVAQRLEQRTHNAHEGARYQSAPLGNTAQIVSVYKGLCTFVLRSTAHLNASMYRLN